MGAIDKVTGKRACICPDLGLDILVGVPFSNVIRVLDMCDDLT